MFLWRDMASPQLENGYTKIANEILEHLIWPGLNGSELKLVLFIIRKTYGFNKKRDKISLSQFCKGLNTKRPNICRTIKSVVAKRLLSKDKNGYNFNKNWEEWVVAKRLHSSQTATGGSSQKDNRVVAKRLHTKETITKETIQKKEYTLFESFWKAYPKKVAKEKALKSWEKIVFKGGLFELIMSQLEKYKKQWIDPQFIPYPATWLNQARWEDEIEDKLPGSITIGQKHGNA